ncbi:DUF4349 domain-containing protein [Halorubrum trueperi]|uniref:DUF4349 domain-containing protein n=1 Tax=Halorubrum trueperi TaxID=2004704 RepID=A0ABD5UPL4_9EURY
MKTRRLLCIVTLAMFVALAGCAGAGGGDAGDSNARESGTVEVDGGDGSGSTTEDAGDDASGELYAAAGGGDGQTDAAEADRQLIRTGDLRVTVDSFEDADAEARSIAGSHDGFVSDSTRETLERGDERYTVGELTLRVPSEEFDSATTDLESLGNVERSTTESRDVTDRLADLEARLENRRAERDRLRELYEDANTTEDVLAVQRELADVQEEIERMEAEQAALEERVALSTIRVELREEPPEADSVTAAWHDTGVVTAFMESVSGVRTVLRAAVVGSAYAAPYLLTALLLLIGVGLAIRYRTNRSEMANAEE